MMKEKTKFITAANASPHLVRMKSNFAEMRKDNDTTKSQKVISRDCIFQCIVIMKLCFYL